MKIIKLTLTFLILITFHTTQAQDGESLINLHAGIGGSIQANDVKTPSFYGSYEYFVGDHLSVGAIVGYAPLSIDTQELVLGQGFLDTKEENSNFVAGALVNYYLASGDTLDFYLGGSLGYSSGLTAGFLHEFHAGARYYLGDNFALSSEVGFGVSLLKVGISFKL